jgi:hypothetical protein
MLAYELFKFAGPASVARLHKVTDQVTDILDDRH